jgi:hypothetical protein
MTLLNERPHDKLPKGELKWQRFAILTLGKNCSNIFNRNCVASILLQHSGSPHFLREKRQKHLTNVSFDACDSFSEESHPILSSQTLDNNTIHLNKTMNWLLRLLN